MAEELLISPDICSPILGLQKVSGRSAKAHSFSPSPVRSGLSSPKSHVYSGVLSPLRMTGSPKGSSHKRNTYSSRKSGASSPSKAGPLLNLNKVFALESTSTPRGVDGTPEIFVEETPDSNVKPSRMSSSSNASSSSSTSRRKIMNISHASRKLSFVVADSDESLNNSSMENSQLSASGGNTKTRTPAAAGTIKLESSIDPDNQSFQESAPVYHKGDISMKSVTGEEERAVSPGKLYQKSVQDTLWKLSTSDALLSPKNISQNIAFHEESRKTTANKRRSVCVQKAVIDESDDDVDNDDYNSKQDSLANGEAENSGEEEMVNDDSDEDDKENMPVYVKNVGGRQRIVSDSESPDSYFEVAESDEEDKQEQKPRERQASSAERKTLTQGW